MVWCVLFAVFTASAAPGIYKCPTQTDGVEDCLECDGHRVLNVDSSPLECIDRDIFHSEFAHLDAIALVAWFLSAGLAVSAGVGGGGIYVPLGALLLRFDPKSATGLSQASIFGASCAGIILNSIARHPKADRPLIDVDMVLFLAPMEMAGAVLGYIILSMCPSWFVILLMVTVLGYTGFRTVRKGLEMWAKDKKAAQAMELKMQEQEDIPCPASSTSDISGQGAEGGLIDPETVKPILDGDGDPPVETKPQAKNMYSVDTWIRKDAARPLKKILYLFVLWLILLLIILLKGGKGKASVVPGWEFCETPYWILTGLSFIWLLGFALLMGRRAVSKTLRKQAVDFPFVEGDVRWTWNNFGLYAGATFVAGIIAGMIGIGGGMVLGPLMLQLGVLPQVSSASTATMIALTSSSVAAMAVIQGNIPVSYALTFFATAFVGALIGKYKIDAFVKKRKLGALLIFLLAGIICTAALMMGVYGLIKYGQRGWKFNLPDDVFRGPCE